MGKRLFPQAVGGRVRRSDASASCSLWPCRRQGASRRAGAGWV